jgi:hypothetical protein
MLIIVRANARALFCMVSFCYRGMNIRCTLPLLLSVFHFFCAHKLIPTDVALYEHSTRYITLYSIHITHSIYTLHA